MTEEIKSMKLAMCQQLNTITDQLNEQSKDWFQRRRELQVLQEQYDIIERGIVSQVMAMSLQEEYKKDLSNAEKRAAKVQEFVDINHSQTVLKLKELKLRLETSAHLMECTERAYRMLLAQARLLGGVE